MGKENFQVEMQSEKRSTILTGPEKLNKVSFLFFLGVGTAATILEKYAVAVVAFGLAAADLVQLKVLGKVNTKKPQLQRA